VGSARASYGNLPDSIAPIGVRPGRVGANDRAMAIDTIRAHITVMVQNQTVMQALRRVADRAESALSG
jgi:hypothetical protein